MDAQRVRRVRCHAGALSPMAFAMAERFRETLSREPGFEGLFSGSKRELRGLVEAWAELVRHVGYVETIREELRGMGRVLTALGVGHGGLDRVSEVVMDVTRSCSGGSWTSELESDWRSFFDDVVAEVRGSMGGSVVRGGGHRRAA